MRRLHSFRMILSGLAALAVMTACTQDELADGMPMQEKAPLELTANLYHSVATPATANTRGTVDGDWENAHTVAVRVNGKVKEYTVNPNTDGSATLTCSDITEADTDFWWTNTTDSKTITAWYPYSTTEPVIGGSWTVTPDQSAGIPVEADLLYATRQITFNNPSLEFHHLMSKVIINILPSDYLNLHGEQLSVKMNDIYCTGILKKNDDYEDRLELYCDFNSVQQTVTPHRLPNTNSGCFASYTALLIPQPFTYMRKSIEIRVGSAVYKWIMNIIANSFYSGHQYTYNIIVKEHGLDVKVSESIGWNPDGVSGDGSVVLP